MPVLTEAERHALAMRLVGDFEARRFHVELATAELVGGGTIAGRVHRDRELAAGPIVVRARCIEAWREAPPRVPIVPANRSMRMPRWHERTLWSQELVLDGLADAHWARLRVRAAARAAARRRGALGRVALRDRGAPPAAPAPRRARDRRAARLPRDAARARSAGAAAARVSERRPPQGGGRLRRAPPGPTSAGGRRIPRGAVDAILAATGAAPGRTLLELGAGTGKLTRALDGQRRARDRARAGRRDARAAGARRRRRRSRSTPSPRRSRSPTRASTPWSPRRRSTGSIPRPRRPRSRASCGPAAPSR